MADSFQPNLSTRQGFIEAIKQSAQYIADHADNLLGEYPSLLCGLDITARFRFDEHPAVEVKRAHFAVPKSEYPQNQAEGRTNAETKGLRGEQQ